MAMVIGNQNYDFVELEKVNEKRTNQCKVL
jgi:hypothetical protein